MTGQPIPQPDNHEPTKPPRFAAYQDDNGNWYLRDAENPNPYFLAWSHTDKEVVRGWVHQLNEGTLQLKGRD